MRDSSILIRDPSHGFIYWAVLIKFGELANKGIASEIGSWTQCQYYSAWVSASLGAGHQVRKPQKVRCGQYFSVHIRNLWLCGRGKQLTTVFYNIGINLSVWNIK